MVESTLKKLDLVPLQVLIEGTIAEVRLTDELRYGLQWFFSEGRSSATLSSIAAVTPAQVFPGFSYLFTGNNVRVMLNALDDISDVNVISSAIRCRYARKRRRPTPASSPASSSRTPALP